MQAEAPDVLYCHWNCEGTSGGASVALLHKAQAPAHQPSLRSLLWKMMSAVALPKDPTVEQRREALYHSTCAHAFAGDLEFAQGTLRGEARGSMASLVAKLQLQSAAGGPAQLCFG